VQLPVRDWTYEGKTKRYFNCELPPFTSIDDVHAMRDEMAPYVKPCLGPAGPSGAHNSQTKSPI
jgi:hypothetical protein